MRDKIILTMMVRELAKAKSGEIKEYSEAWSED
jgi:hypothetical protein